VATSLTAFCPFRREKYPVSPTATKICSTNGTIKSDRRESLYLGLDRFREEFDIEMLVASLENRLEELLA
jgi:hypothetical protein